MRSIVLAVGRVLVLVAPAGAAIRVEGETAAGRSAAREICQMIQGADVADFTPGHRVVDRRRVGIRRCRPRRD